METSDGASNPVLLKTLLVSLVEEVGVAPSDITVYDVSRLFPDHMVELCTEGILDGVHFVDRRNGIADENTPINWSYEFSGAVNYLPTCVTEADFLINEPAVTDRNGALRDNPNVENYLHEAGLVGDAPSGNVYQNGDGEIVVNLGVHEHWNNSVEKLYSRNLGADEGIELIGIMRDR